MHFCIPVTNLLPRDVDITTTFALFSIPEPKTRMVAARHQAAKLDIPDLLALVDMVFGDLDKGCRLWPSSGQTLRNRLKQILHALELPIQRSLGMKPLDLGSLRSGGASWLLMTTEQSELVRRRGRWLNNKTMEIYLRESAAVLYLQTILVASKKRVLCFATLFRQIFDKTLVFKRAKNLLHSGISCWVLKVDRPCRAVKPCARSRRIAEKVELLELVAESPTTALTRFLSRLPAQTVSHQNSPGRKVWVWTANGCQTLCWHIIMKK